MYKFYECVKNTVNVLYPVVVFLSSVHSNSAQENIYIFIALGVSACLKMLTCLSTQAYIVSYDATCTF